MTPVSKPDKSRVRDLMAKHIKERTPPLTPEQFREQLGWNLLKNNGSR